MFDGLLTAIIISSATEQAWSLTRNGVEVHDAKTLKRTQIALPGWQWAGRPNGCAPNIAIGPKGEALVPSDVVPVLWRIDPASLAVSRHDPVLDADQGRDIGFSGLVYSAELGVFYALSAHHGSLWRIDPTLRRAQEIPLSEPVRNGCELVVQKKSRFIRLCVRTAQGGWTINLAPDQRSGYVHPRRCAN